MILNLDVGVINVEYFLLIITGLSAGALVSAGVFALITSTGVMSRLAGKSHTGRYVRLYETMVVLGGIWWNISWVFQVKLNIPEVLQPILLSIMGIAQGIFVGCLAVALAEALNATAIFARRVKLKTGLSFIILSVAIGKVVAAIIQFAGKWVN